MLPGWPGCPRRELAIPTTVRRVADRGAEDHLRCLPGALEREHGVQWLRHHFDPGMAGLGWFGVVGKQ